MRGIAVIGTGYVGLVTGTCLAEFGMKVVCHDVDEEKITGIIEGRMPIYEQGLSELVKKNASAERLSFSSDFDACIDSSDVVFIAVGTPPMDDGSADLSAVLQVAECIARSAKNDKIVVLKSTVPVGTSEKVREVLRGNNGVKFAVVSNPEFLREGSAIYDFMHPDRVVIGSDSDEAIGVMKEVYSALYLNETPFVICDNVSAELIKYASNAFLATKISFINDIARLCDATGANVQVVAKAVGADGRIGPKFLHPGPGFGGSCFPKDTKALIHAGEQHGVSMNVVSAAVKTNEDQQRYAIDKIIRAFGGSISGKTMGVLGLTFKPNTDDMRDAPSLSIVSALIEKGATVHAYDPQAEKEFATRFGSHEGRCRLMQNEYAALENVEALILITEWNAFRKLDLGRIRKMMKGNLFIDLRNVYSRSEVEAYGFQYVGMGC